MIDGHQLVAIKLSDGLHMIDPGKGKTYDKAQIEGVCKVGEDIDAVGNDLEFFSGTCGKNGQSMPTATGGPTIRVKKLTIN